MKVKRRSAHYTRLYSEQHAPLDPKIIDERILERITSSMYKENMLRKKRRATAGGGMNNPKTPNKTKEAGGKKRKRDTEDDTTGNCKKNRLCSTPSNDSRSTSKKNSSNVSPTSNSKRNESVGRRKSIRLENRKEVRIEVGSESATKKRGRASRRSRIIEGESVDKEGEESLNSKGSNDAKKNLNTSTDSDVEDEEYVVERIDGHKWRDGVLHYKVRWEGYDRKYDTLEPVHGLQSAKKRIKEYKETLSNESRRELESRENPKRKRGRPSNVSKGASVEKEEGGEEAGDAVEEGSTESTKKRGRGRPPKKSNRESRFEVRASEQKTKRGRVSTGSKGARETREDSVEIIDDDEVGNGSRRHRRSAPSMSRSEVSRDDSRESEEEGGAEDREESEITSSVQRDMDGNELVEVEEEGEESEGEGEESEGEGEEVEDGGEDEMEEHNGDVGANEEVDMMEAVDVAISSTPVTSTPTVDYNTMSASELQKQRACRRLFSFAYEDEHESAEVHDKVGKKEKKKNAKSTCLSANSTGSLRDDSSVQNTVGGREGAQEESSEVRVEPDVHLSDERSEEGEGRDYTDEISERGMDDGMTENEEVQSEQSLYDQMNELHKFGVKLVMTKDDEGQIECYPEGHREESIDDSNLTRHSVLMRGTGSDTKGVVVQRVEEWKENGFINYFSPNDFGDGPTAAAIGKLMLKGEWESAALSIRPLLTPPSDGDTWESTIPLDMKRYYVHAFCAFLWNEIVTHRLELYGVGVRTGDLDKEEKWQLLPGTSPFCIRVPLPNKELRGMATVLYKAQLKKHRLDYNNVLKYLDVKEAEKGGKRRLLERPTDVKWEEKMMDDDDESWTIDLSFTIPANVDVCVALREITPEVDAQITPEPYEGL